MHLFSLPNVVLEHIFTFLTFDQVAQNRLVCKDFDIICQRVLNRGFQLMEKRLSANLKAIKAQLPRRESERRFHPLSRHCDILTSIETRFSMLSMAYGRFIEQGMCCFIPGKVLDELRHVISVVDEMNPLPLAFELLQELRDISGMAMEHFDDVVAPTLRQKMQENAVAILPFPAVNRNETDKKMIKPAFVPILEMTLLREACLKNNKNILKLEKRCTKLYRKLELYKRLMALNKRRMLQKQFEQDRNIAELKRKLEEYEVKFNELSLSQYVGYKNMVKETDTKNRITNIIAKTNRMMNLMMRVRLRNYGSQIKLDPSPLRIGPNRGGRGSPIIKPRRAGLNPPSHKIAEDLILESPTRSSSNEQNRSSLIIAKCADPELKNVIDRLKKALNEFDETKNSKSGEDFDFLRKYAAVLESRNEAPNVESSPKPSTSKVVPSEDDDDDYDVCNSGGRGKKRPHSEISTKSKFQINSEPLAKTIMKIIESMTDNQDAKRKRKQPEDDNQ